MAAPCSPKWYPTAYSTCSGETTCCQKPRAHIFTVQIFPSTSILLSQFAWSAYVPNGAYHQNSGQAMASPQCCSWWLNNSAGSRYCRDPAAHRRCTYTQVAQMCLRARTRTLPQSQSRLPCLPLPDSGDGMFVACLPCGLRPCRCCCGGCCCGCGCCCSP